MTVFSGLAALLCLLVGLQLLALESHIGQVSDEGPANSGLQLRNWKAQAHNGAVMSLGAGVLIFLFGLRHHTTTVLAGKRPGGGEDPLSSSIDPQTLTIRVFESAEDDRYVEISDGSELEPAPPLPAISSRRSPVDLDNDVEPEADPTDTIVESIQQAVARGAVPEPGARPGRPRRSFIGRLFGRRRP